MSDNWVMDSTVKLLKSKAREDQIIFTQFVVDNMIAKNKGLFEDILAYLDLEPSTDILGFQKHLLKGNC